MATTWEDQVISVSKLVGHYILLDIFDICLINENIFLSRDIPTKCKYHRSLMGLPYRSMGVGSFTELFI